MNSIAKEAYTWLGTPHVNGAKVKGKGVQKCYVARPAVEEAHPVVTE